MDLRRLHPWLLRASWAALAFTAGPLLAEALDPRSAAVRTTASALLWSGWFAGLCGAMVPHPIALTVLRLVAPGAVVAALLAAFASEADARAAMGLASAVLAVLLAFAPATGVAWVNGPAYPNERRYPLRPPTPLLFGPLELSWAVAVGGPVAGALLLAARQWVAGAVVLAVCLPLAALLGRSLYGLARRWVVFVPAGLVLHDPLALVDPVLFTKEHVRALGPAEPDTDALDLTQRAAGLVLQLTLDAPASLLLSGPKNRSTKAVEAGSLLFLPTRPGSVLEEAAARRLPVS